MLRKALVVALLAFLPASARAQSAAADFRDYQSLLDQYLCRSSASGEPFDTRFDYEQLYVDEKLLTLKRSERLERIHAQLLAVNPSGMAAAERLAWGLNTYNFLVIEHITTHLLLPQRRVRPTAFVRYSSVDEIFMPSGTGFFQSSVAVVDGRDYTLDGFQRRFVFGDTTSGSGPRPPLADPRVCFATNPGRVGAPPLMPVAFRADSLDSQLDRATRTALALPQFVMLRRDPPQLLVSEWLRQSPGEFGGSVPKLLAFVQKYSPRAVRDGIRNAHITGVNRYMPVNPRLNQRDNPRLAPPAAAESTGAAR